MKKEDLLEKSRKENEQGDEREEQVALFSFGYGAIVVTLLCIVFSIIKAVQGERFYEFGAIIFGYLSACGFYRFLKTKNKKALFSAVVTMVAAVGAVVAFFLIKQ